MILVLTPSQSQIQAALVSFLNSVLPALGSDGQPISVVEGIDNRVPEPEGVDFVIFSMLSRPRLATNIDEFGDVEFFGFAVANELFVTEAIEGDILIGAMIFGPGVAPGTTILSQIAGLPGAEGAYVISIPQTIPAAFMSSGASSKTQKTEIVVQLDVHGANLRDASDMAQIITTTFRDAYAVDFFQNLNAAITPLHADDPTQVSFVNAEDQYESRYVVEARLQVDQTVSGFPQQSAVVLEVDVISVEAEFHN